MEKAIWSLVSTGIDMAIRVWMKDKESYITDNVLDFERLAVKLGCDYFTKNGLESNINDYIRTMGQKLYQSTILQGLEEERKIVIINQVCEDIKAQEIFDSSFTEAIIQGEDIKTIIEKHSIHERKLWSSVENGVYNNCLRYVSDAIIKYVSELPKFTSDAIKILYQKNEDMFTAFDEQLDQIIKLLKKQRGTQVDYREFETDYLLKVARENRKVELFGSGLSERRTKRYDISTSYIELCCSEYDDNFDNSVSMSKIFKDNNIVWISGEAGGGKTTFIQWLATTSAMKSCTIDEANELIPIVLKLRKVDFPINLKNEMEKNLSLECPSGWIDYIFKYDRVLLLFDGVDEISNEDRDQLYNYIEDIVEEWEQKYRIKSKIVITARNYVEDIFEFKHVHYKILRMKMDNIKKFILYWHKTVLTDIIEDQSEIEDRANRLIDNIISIQAIRNIAGTPLLCAMICALSYISNEAIPTNRIELYDKCCHMLIEDRDKERKINAEVNSDLKTLDFAKKIRIIENIAFYMLECEKAEMEKNSIIDYIKYFLEDSTIIESKKIKDNPEILVDYLVHRTGILREPTIGHIDFVHKTFLEYFAANAINRQCKWDIINAHAINPFWKETIIMCFNQINRKKGSEILRSLLDEYIQTSEQEYIFMASLCANNASDIETSIRDQINQEIKNLIPPTKKNIQRLSEARQYILPFLFDKNTYDNDQKFNCITLLNCIFLEDCYLEEIPVLLSYMYGNGTYAIKASVAAILVNYSDNYLEENNVPEKMYESVCKTLIKDKKCILSSDMLRLIAIPEEIGKDSFHNVEELEIRYEQYIDNDIDEIRLIDDTIYKHFCSVKKLILENVTSIKNIQLLQELKNLKDLSVYVLRDDDLILDKIGKFKRAEKIKEFLLDSDVINYICYTDFKNFNELVVLKMRLGSPNLEIDIDDWKFSTSLKRVILNVDRAVFMEYLGLFAKWRDNYPEIEFTISEGV